MSGRKALVKTGLKPGSYQIPQTVTSPIERREIRNFIGMRQKQMKSRLDRIYRFKKEQFVDGKYAKKLDAIKKDRLLADLITRYNKDNKKISSLLKQKQKLTEQVEVLCDIKQRVSDKIRQYAISEDDLDYCPSTYGSSIDRHSENTINPEHLLAEQKILDKIKEEFDTKNSKQMENRNQRLNYLNEKIEERLLFGKRDEIQKLFCDLERMNTMIEQELVSLGIDNSYPLEEEGK